MRIVRDFNLLEQDRLATRISTIFEDGMKPPKVIDRRENPSFGYRAVHVVVYVRDIPIEVQIRTHWQHEWANYFEKLADVLGRGIRYGQGPDDISAGLEGLVLRAIANYDQDMPEIVDAYRRYIESRRQVVARVLENAQHLSAAFAAYEQVIAGLSTIDLSNLNETQAEPVRSAIQHMVEHAQEAGASALSRRRDIINALTQLVGGHTTFYRELREALVPAIMRTINYELPTLPDE